MFAIHAPTTVTLTTPGKDGPFETINFKNAEHDTSRCVMEIMTPDGDTHILTFNTRGHLIDQTFIDHDSAPVDDPEARPLTHADYMVDGRDMRAFDPYTYQPPVTADTATSSSYAPAPIRGEPEDATELKKQHYEDSARRAKEAREQLLNQASETPEERAERERKDREEQLARLEASLEPMPSPSATSKTYPDDAKVDQNARSDGSPNVNPDGDPMAPPASSPLPGSPPPHPLDRPDVGKVNTSASMQTEPNNPRNFDLPQDGSRVPA